MAIGEDRMQHQIYLATQSGKVSDQTVDQIRTLITALTDNAKILGAAIGGKRKSARSDDGPIMTALKIRRRNIQASIVVLEDYLATVERLRSHPDSAPILPPHAALLRV